MAEQTEGRWMGQDTAADRRTGPRRRGGIGVFVTVAFAVTWALWLPLLVRAQTTGLATVPWSFFVASMGPPCGAVAASLYETGPAGTAAWARRIFSVGFPARWWWAGLGLPAAYALIGWVAVVLTTGAWPDPAGFGLTQKLPGLGWPLVALVWVLTFGVGEEVGWRGWLLPALPTAAGFLGVARGRRGVDRLASARVLLQPDLHGDGRRHPRLDGGAAVRLVPAGVVDDRRSLEHRSGAAVACGLRPADGRGPVRRRHGRHDQRDRDDSGRVQRVAAVASAPATIGPAPDDRHDHLGTRPIAG